MAIIVTFAIIGAVIVTVLFWHMVSVDRRVVGNEIVHCIFEHVPVRSLKIAIVMWQIITQVRVIC